MYPILILREELVCLIILIFLATTAASYDMGKDSSAFTRLVIFALIHVVLDIVTILTVNNVWKVSAKVNDIFHVLFYMSAILFSGELFDYVIRLCFGSAAKVFGKIGYALAALYLISLRWLPIEYVATNGTRSSTGPAAYVGFGLAFVLFFVALICIFLNFPRLERSVRRALVPMLLVLVVAEVAQVIVREMLFTGGAVTIVTVGFFFSLENPVHVLEHKVMTDALTGVRSRHSYNERMKQFETDFRKRPSDRYAFVYCDINSLRRINNRFGHSAGDKYISIVANAITESAVHSEGIYRLGGDEFVIIYIDTDTAVINSELNNIRKILSETKTSEGYTPAVSMGVARSTKDNKNLEAVANSADFLMFENKTRANQVSMGVGMDASKTLNIEGLTSRLFDAISHASDREYPFITNLETYTTRISPSWKEFFGLPDEFFNNFNDTWIEYVHPDDRQAFEEDIKATVSGQKRYHNCDYRALTPSGEYVKCSCHGAVYHGGGNSPDIFAGFLTNHGVAEKIDTLTGLPNFLTMDEYVQNAIDGGGTSYVLKFQLNNLAKLDMLYGYESGNALLKEISAVLTKNAPESATVFCDNSSHFSVFFDTYKWEEVDKYYNDVVDALRQGVPFGKLYVPIDVSGGATIVTADITPDKNSVRRRLLASVEESTFTKHGDLVFYYDIPEAAGDSDYTHLSYIHRDALSDFKHFFLKYQPIVDTATGELRGAEALLRYKRPETGELNPASFISFLENDICMHNLGMHIIRTAVRFAKTISKKVPGFTVNVNITAIQLRNPDFIPNVVKVLEDEGLPPSQIILELTERCKEMKSEFLAEKVRALQSHGIRVAYDDMGTGYSTVNLLMDIPADEIKLDKDFVFSLDTNPLYSVFVESLFKAREAGSPFLICFEGVETEEKLAKLRSYGNSLCQGYLFSVPLTDKDFEKFAENNKHGLFENSNIS